jgi:trans-2-enoyl-CoA reductase
MGIKSFVNQSKANFGEKQELKLTVPEFKKHFSNNVKKIWDKLENGTDEDNLKDLYDLVKNAIGNLELLKHDLLDYSSYSDDKTDFI